MRTSGSMSGVWNSSMRSLLGHRRSNGPVTSTRPACHRATPRLYSSACREPGFEGLIGGDAVKTLYQLLQQAS